MPAALAHNYGSDRKQASDCTWLIQMTPKRVPIATFKAKPPPTLVLSRTATHAMHQAKARFDESEKEGPAPIGP